MVPGAFAFHLETLASLEKSVFEGGDWDEKVELAACAGVESKGSNGSAALNVLKIVRLDRSTVNHVVCEFDLDRALLKKINEAAEIIQVPSGNSAKHSPLCV